MNTEELHTERQIGLFKEIGSSWRERIDSEIRKILLSEIIVILVTSLISISILFIDRFYFVIFIFMEIIVIVNSIIDYIKRAKKLVELRNQNDYTIGLFYKDIDSHVVGHADKNLKEYKKAAIVFACLGAFWLILFAVISLILGKNIHDYSRLHTINGYVERVDILWNDEIIFNIENDSTMYKIDPMYAKYVDILSLVDAINEGDSVVLLVDGKDSLTKRTIYYAEIAGAAYLDYDTMQLGLHDEMIIAYVLLGFFLTVGISGSISYPVYKKFFFQKQKDNEKYYLDFTTEELESLRLNMIN